LLRATGLALCTPLPPITGSPGPGADTLLPSLPDQRKEARSRFHPHRRRRSSLPLQNHATQGLDLARDHPRTQEASEVAIILSPEEVLQFLGCVPSPKHRTILTTCYAAGLRISEVVRLKPNHIDSQRMVIRVELGKGQKDRYVMLSPRLLE